MEVQRFEQAILKLAFETDAKITTASVAYYLGIPSREANRLLNQLLEEGVLELDSDEGGNLFYRVPNKGEISSALLPTASETTPLPMPSPKEAVAPQPQRSHHFVSIDDDESPALSPHHHGQDVEPITPWQPEPQGYVNQDNIASSRRDYYKPHGQDGEARRPHSPVVTGSNHHFAPDRTARQEGPRQDRWEERAWDPSSSRKSRTTTTTAPEHDLFYGTTARVAAPDATVNRCGASNMVVSTEVRCEPKPLPEARPVVVSCTGVDTSQNTIAHTDYGFGYATPRATTALATTGDFALTADSHIEQPEHQPGMALLLSLILCGTGQIYNGEVSKGIIMMVLCFLLWFVLLGWVVHIWSIVDAVVVAERINRKHG